MRLTRAVVSGLFAVAAIVGTVLDSRARLPERPSSVLVADLHVHPYPGDGSLPTWELQREAQRRGIDVIAVTGHNNRFGLNVGRLVPLEADGPILLRGQEITTPSFHMIAVGIERLIDWRLPARDAIAAIHAQGGVAIAAHPGYASWRVRDEAALRALDGAELAHPSTASFSPARNQFQRFFHRARTLNPDLSPIGSSDFHMTAPLGLCRTYLLATERSAAGALDAIRHGRTVARDTRGELFGAPENVAAVQQFLSTAPAAPIVSSLERFVALTALLALAALCVPLRVS